MSAWQHLDSELDAWRAAGLRADLWLRDDDACRDTPALCRLLEIANSANVPVALAVIPALMEERLADRLADESLTTILQHGDAHRNHAPPGARNWELGSHRPVEEVIAELVAGRKALSQCFGTRFADVLVPPWNRIDQQVVARLADAGFTGLSTFGARAAAHPSGVLVQCNTHVDLIAWRRGRVFVGADAAIERLVAHLKARREGAVDPGEPSGILTHHLDVDAAAWQFLADLLAQTRAHGAATWIDAHIAFGPVTSSRSA